MKVEFVICHTCQFSHQYNSVSCGILFSRSLQSTLSSYYVIYTSAVILMNCSSFEFHTIALFRGGENITRFTKRNSINTSATAAVHDSLHSLQLHLQLVHSGQANLGQTNLGQANLGQANPGHTGPRLILVQYHCADRARLVQSHSSAGFILRIRLSGI